MKFTNRYICTHPFIYLTHISTNYYITLCVCVNVCILYQLLSSNTISKSKC